MINPNAQQRLRSAVDAAKLALSSVMTHTVELVLHDVKHAAGTPGVFALPITRAKFEDLNAAVFRKIMAPVHCVLRDGEIHKSQIHEVSHT